MIEDRMRQSDEETDTNDIEDEDFEQMKDDKKLPINEKSLLMIQCYLVRNKIIKLDNRIIRNTIDVKDRVLKK